MYKRNVSRDEKDAIRRGHMPTLLRVLKETDATLTKDLKMKKDGVAFQQGASYIVDQLIDIIDPSS